MGFHVGIRFRFTEICSIDFFEIIKIESIKVELTPRLGFAKRKSFKRDAKCKVKCNQVENIKTYLNRPPPYSHSGKINELIVTDCNTRNHCMLSNDIPL